MDDIRVGVNLPKSSNPQAIRETLRQFAADGFDHVEVTLDTWPLIVGGEIKRDYVDFAKRLLREFPFSYSAHIGRDVDLRDAQKFPIQKRALFASVDVCGMVGMDPLVLHFEEKSKDASVEERFFEAHVEAADRAAEAGLRLCIENIEVERVLPVVEFVQRVSRPNVAMNLDVGHAFLAARYFQFDFLEAVRLSLPVLGHTHLSDNMGIFEELRITDRLAYDSLPEGYRATFARGDIHFPPFWGSIPFQEVFGVLKDYRGPFICEYCSDRFLPFNRQIQEKVRQAVRRARM